jgi:hypothetical protein
VDMADTPPGSLVLLWKVDCFVIVSRRRRRGSRSKLNPGLCRIWVAAMVFTIGMGMETGICSFFRIASWLWKMFEDEDIPKRKPVWPALADLWLDTELQPDELERIGTVMDASGYSVPELREIYLFEVAPIVSPNLLCVAGEWAGFDEDWLLEKIIRFGKRKGSFIRFLTAIGIGRWIMTYATERHWVKLVEIVKRKRSQQPDGATTQETAPSAAP